MPWRASLDVSISYLLKIFLCAFLSFCLSLFSRTTLPNPGNILLISSSDRFYVTPLPLSPNTLYPNFNQFCGLFFFGIQFICISVNRNCFSSLKIKQELSVMQWTLIFCYKTAHLFIQRSVIQCIGKMINSNAKKFAFISSFSTLLQLNRHTLCTYYMSVTLLTMCYRF